MPFIGGDPWVICDLSGMKVRMSQTRKTWDGLRVYSPFWYPRHPQLDLRTIPDNPAVQDARSDPTPIFVDSSGGLDTTYNGVDPADVLPEPTWDDMA